MNSPSIALRTTDARRSRRAALVAAAAAALVAVGAMLMMGYDGTAGAVFPLALLLTWTAGAVFPLALLLTWVMLNNPWVLYAITLAHFSILPVENYMMGFYVPNLTQFLVPALFIAIAATTVARRQWGTFRLRTADVFVTAFVLIAILGIALEPGYKNWKTFGNQVLFAISLYYTTRWLQLDRQRFRTTLKWVLIAAAVMLADLALVQLFRVGRIWERAGPLGTLSDQATYSALFPPFFLYMAATASGPSARRDRILWLVAALIGVIAAAGGKERSGVVAGLAGLTFCIVHPRMFRYVAIGVIALIPIGAWWLSTSVGSHVHSRFSDDQDPMLRRRIYVGKAIDYINSEKWNPIWGTGFWRLKTVSNEMLSREALVWDANKNRWRLEYEIGQRPIHCAPVTVFGEYGYGGVFCLIGLGGCALYSLAAAYRRARRTGRQFDTVFLVAAAGAGIGLLINAGFHNTEQVFPVTALWWAFMGLVVGHANVLIMSDTEQGEESAPRGPRRRSAAG